ncbi:hypothetical protein JW905_18370 [bacterium]|nr:hypothetical protein [candidate division CSSED10-310 bacterium]
MPANKFRSFLLAYAISFAATTIIALGLLYFLVYHPNMVRIADGGTPTAASETTAPPAAKNAGAAEASPSSEQTQSPDQPEPPTPAADSVSGARRPAKRAAAPRGAQAPQSKKRSTAVPRQPRDVDASSAGMNKEGQEASGEVNGRAPANQGTTKGAAHSAGKSVGGSQTKRISKPAHNRGGGN